MAELIIFLVTRLVCITAAGVIFWEPISENASVQFNNFKLRTKCRSFISRWRAASQKYQALGQVRWFPKLMENRLIKRYFL
ncbi:hypothetical protein FHW89_002592 [Mucilaginibacter sp. SG564]|nr:hypothetical protein [Mucilaginibacter sp. SG564]